MRSAEANRTSTNLFADRIASLSISYYRQHCPEELFKSYQQTVLSTFIIQYPYPQLAASSFSDEYKSTLKVVSLGVGTKTLSTSMIEKDMLNKHRVRDCHAEILARKGLLKYLHSQISLCIDIVMKSFKTSIEVEDMMNDRDCIFEFDETTSLLRLKTGIKIHMYSSSIPCGNASIKRWAKCCSPIFQSNLSADEYESLEYPAIHNRIHITARNEGQVAILVKINHYTKETLPGTENCTQSQYIDTDNSFTNPEEECPENIKCYHTNAGTASVTSGLGNIMTCSDKIAKWNALGLQGAFLCAVMHPIYLASITIGRKFSKVHCERALCCRLQDFQYCSVSSKLSLRNSQTFTLCNKNENNFVVDSNASLLNNYHLSTNDTAAITRTSSRPYNEWRIHHPVMLGTKVKFDEGVIITSAPTPIPSESSQALFLGASFKEARCLCCFSQIFLVMNTNKAISIANDEITRSTTTLTKSEIKESVHCEVIDSLTGLLQMDPGLQITEDISLTKDLNTVIPKCQISSIASSQLLISFQEIYKNFYRINQKELGDMSDMDYNAQKQKVQRGYVYEYQQAKDKLYSDPHLFKGWIRKNNS